MNTFSINQVRTLDPANEQEKVRDIHVVNGELSDKAGENAKNVDGKSWLLCPGFIDLYARLREPGYSRKGTIKSETKAALRAGFTTVLCAPDTDPVIDSTATVELIRQRAIEANAARVIPIAALTSGLEGERLSELATLYSAGCLLASNADKPVINSAVMLSAMEYAASFDIPILHAPLDAHIGSAGCAHAGAYATKLGLPGIPAAAETVALTSLLELCRCTGVRLHLSRLSTARSTSLLRQAKAEGLPVTADVGIHHLYFTDAQLPGFDTNFHSAVPFRSIDDRDALRDAVADNTIDAICSDHAPQDTDAKLAPFASSGPGLSAFDVFLPLLLSLPDLLDVSLQQIINKVTIGPASIITASDNSLPLNTKLPAIPTATLTTGSAADLILIDTEALQSIDSEQLNSLGHNTPLTGMDNLNGCTGENIALKGCVKWASISGIESALF